MSEKPRPRRSIRLLKWLGGISLLLVGLYLLRGPLFADLLRDKIVSEVRDATGLELEIASVEGSWLSDLTLVGCRVSGLGESDELRVLGAERIAVEFSLFDLLDEPLDGLRAVSVSGADVRIVVNDDASDGANTESTLRALIEFPFDRLPPTRVDTFFSLDDSGVVVESTIGIDAASGRIAVDLRDLRIALPQGEIHASRMETVIAPTTGALAIDGALEGDEFTVRSIRLHEVDGHMQLETTIDAGGRIDATLWQDSIDAVLTDVDLRAVPSIVEAIVGQPLPGGTILAATVELRRGQPAAFSAVEAHDLHGYGGRLDTVAVASGTFDGDTLTVEGLRSTRGAARLELGSAGLVVDYPLASLSWTDLQLDVSDVRAAVLAVAEHQLPIADGISGSVSSARLDDRQTTFRFEAATQFSKASGTVAARIPTLADLEAESRDRTLRESATQIDATGALDVRDVLPLLPESWELPEIEGRLLFSVSSSDPGTDAAGRIELDAPGLVLDGHAVDLLSLRAALRDGLVTVESAHVESALGAADLSGALALSENHARDVRFDLRSDDLSRVSETFSALPTLAGSLQISGTSSGNLRGAIETLLDGRTDVPDNVRAACRIAGADLRVGDADLGALTARVALEGPRITAEECTLDGALARVVLRGGGRVDGREIDVPELDASIPHLEALDRWIPALEDLRGRVHVAGSLHMDDLRDLGDIDGALNVDSETLTVAGHEFDGIRIRARADAGDIRVSEFSSATPWGAVRGGGRLRIDGEHIVATVDGAQVQLDRSVLLLEGGPIPAQVIGPVAIEWGADQLDVTGLRVATLGGEVHGTVSLGRRVEVALDADGLGLTALEPDLHGQLDAALRISGDPAGPDASLVAAVPQLTWGTERGRVDIDISQSADGVRLTSCEIDAGPRLRIDASGYLPYRFGSEGAVRSSDERATLTADATCVDPNAWITRFAPDGFRAASATATLRASGGDLAVTASVVDAEWIDVEDNAGVRFDGPTTIRMEAGPQGFVARVHGGNETLKLDGEVTSTQAIDWRAPREILDDLFEAPLEGQVSLTASQLRSFAAWVDVLRSVRGSGHVTAKIGGSLSSPDLRGVAELDDVWLRAQADLPAIDRGRLRAVLDGRAVRIEELTARLGYAPVSASGTVDLTAVTDPVFDVHVQGEEAQLLRAPYVRARADLDVRITGPLSGMLIQGDVRITDAVYTQPVDLLAAQHTAGGAGFQLFSLRDPPLSDARFDLHVQALDSLVVDNNVIRGRLSADLQLGGTGRVPAPVGRLEFENVRVRLPLTRLTVDQGAVEFPADNPFEPNLRVSAFTRIQGYELDIRVRGGMSDARLFVASSPPLSQEDSLILLATGSAPQSASVGGAAMAGAGSLLGEATMAWLSGTRTPGEDSLADRINVEVGRERSETGYATLEAEVKLIPRWYLRFERDRWDHYDAGLLWRIHFR